MTLYSKYSSLQENFTNFIHGLDIEFITIKEAAKKISGNSHDDVRHCVRDLQKLAEMALSFIKGKKDEIFIEKTKFSNQAISQYVNNGVNGTYDISNNIRNIVQKGITHFELYYNEKSGKYYKPVIGSVWNEIAEWLNNFSESDFCELHRSHEVQLSISNTTIEIIFNNLSNSLTQFAETSVNVLRQKVQDIQNEVKENLAACSITCYSFPEPVFDFSCKCQELIQTSLRIEIPYQGSYARKNLRTLIFEMRSFAMMFLLLLSSFGINRYIAKNENAKTLVYVISLVLIVIGVFVTFANAQDSKSERLEDEFRKAREKIIAEIKRGVNEFITEWKNLVFINLRAALADISAEADRLIREDTKKKSDNTVVERLRHSQLSQMLDIKDRNYQELSRKFESWKIQIDTFFNESERLSKPINN